MKIRVLDLFCCAGGAAVGYHRAFTEAGFDVEINGVDIAPQKHYPFRIIKADAMTFPLDGFDFVHASPPCQAHSVASCVAKKHNGTRYETGWMLAAMYERLRRLPMPWIIENVNTAHMRHPIILCGAMFDLRVYRHRKFDCSHLIWQPPHPRHVIRANGPTGQRQRKAHYLSGGFVTVTGDIGSYAGEAMGIDWMTGAELSQAIPPAYTHWLGLQIAQVIKQQEAVSA